VVFKVMDCVLPLSSLIIMIVEKPCVFRVVMVHDPMRIPYLVCIQIIGSGRRPSKIGSNQYLRMKSSRNGSAILLCLFEAS